MRFRVEIECDNAAFDGLGALRGEVGRLLLKIENYVILGEDQIPLVDYNGNRVGRAWFEED